MIFKKILNFRPVFFLALFLLLGVIFARNFLNLEAEYFVLFFIVFVLIFVFCFANKKHILFAISLLAIFALGIFLFWTSSTNFTKTNSSLLGNKNISGTISQKLSSKENYNVYLIENALFEGFDDRQNILVYVYNDNNELKLGSTISFSASVASLKVEDYRGINTYYAKYNVKYSTSCQFKKITILSENPNLSQIVQSKVQKILDSGCDSNSSQIIFSSLFGDKSSLNSSINDDFSALGIGHLLAVSGLHIGFVCLILSFLFKKIKINKYIQIGLYVAILGFYSYICNFSCSVVRASIMFVSYFIGKTLMKRQDTLSSWGLAMIIIIFINPLNCFDYGFLMSFFAIFSLIMLSENFSKFLQKFKIKRKFASSISSVLAVQLGLLPIIANSYKKFYPISILANIILIPFFELCYIATFILVPFGAISPTVAKIALFLPNKLFTAFLSVSSFLSNLEIHLNLPTFSFLSIFLFFAILFVLSKYFFSTKKRKITISCLLVLISTCSMFLTYSRQSVPINSFVILKENDGYCYILKDSNSNYFSFSNTENSFAFNNFVTYSKIRKFEASIVTSEIKYTNNTNTYQTTQNFNKTFETISTSNQNYAFYFSVNGKRILIMREFESVILFEQLSQKAQGSYDYIIFGNKVFDKNKKCVYSVNNDSAVCIKINKDGFRVFKRYK